MVWWYIVVIQVKLHLQVMLRVFKQLILKLTLSFLWQNVELGVWFILACLLVILCLSYECLQLRKGQSILTLHFSEGYTVLSFIVDQWSYCFNVVVIEDYIQSWVVVIEGYIQSWVVVIEGYIQSWVVRCTCSVPSNTQVTINLPCIGVPCADLTPRWRVWPCVCAETL